MQHVQLNFSDFCGFNDRSMTISESTGKVPSDCKAFKNAFSDATCETYQIIIIIIEAMQQLDKDWGLQNYNFHFHLN